MIFNQYFTIYTVKTFYLTKKRSFPRNRGEYVTVDEKNGFYIT